MKVGIVGTGDVGRALAAGLSRAGHEVALGSRVPANIETMPPIHIVTRKEAAAWAEVVILAVPFHAVQDTVKAIGPNAVHGKVLVDATNAVGTTGLAVGYTTSGAEDLQALVPGARVVKAFNTVFASLMSTGKVGAEPLALFIAGDDIAAKETVLRLGRDLGFDPVDAGPLRNARYLEPLAMQLMHLAYGPPKMGTNLGLKLLRGTP
jgi:predicted dinucleotide-binding enzyme